LYLVREINLPLVNVMVRRGLVFAAAAAVSLATLGHAANDRNFKLALVEHKGQLSWSARGFKVVESSAKPTGREIGMHYMVGLKYTNRSQKGGCVGLKEQGGGTLGPDGGSFPQESMAPCCIA